MRFIEFMAKLVKGKRGCIAVVAAAVFLFACILTVAPEFASGPPAGKADGSEQMDNGGRCPYGYGGAMCSCEGNDKPYVNPSDQEDAGGEELPYGLQVCSLAYLVDCAIWIVLIVIWLFSVRRFKRSIEIPTKLWNDNEVYQSILEHYKMWCGMDGEKELDSAGGRRERRAQYVVAVKAFFYLFWLLYVAVAVLSMWELGINVLQKLFLITLTIIVTILNAPTYFLCFSYVVLLGDMTKDEVSSKLPFLHRWPSSTPEYLHLLMVARYNSLVFLVVVLLCSVGVLLHMFLLPAGNHPLWISEVVSVTIVSIVSCSVLVVMTRMLLSRLVQKWEIEAIELHASDFGGATVNGSLDISKDPMGDNLEQIVKRKSVSLASADVLSILLGILSLLVDALALFVTLGIP